MKGYKKTVNPDLPGQKIQKGYFKEAIEEWQKAGFTSFDIQAWNLRARVKKVTLSGYNIFTGLRIDAAKAGKTWEKLTNCIISEITGSGSKVNINIASDKTGRLYLGTSKKAMFQVYSGIFDIDHYLFTIDDLSMLTRYYFKIKNIAVGEVAETGIYSLKTSGVIIIPIDIGGEAIDRDSSYAPTITMISKTNPANASGVITSIEVWAAGTIENFEVATFFETAPNVFTTRDNHFIGQVISGSKRTYPVNLDVQVGDYIGFYGTEGMLEKDDTGGLGYWYKGGDNIPCTDVTFSLSSYTTHVFSVYGKGST